MFIFFQKLFKSKIQKFPFHKNAGLFRKTEKEKEKRKRRPTTKSQTGAKVSHKLVF